MGLFDKVKGMVKNAQNVVQNNAPQQQQHQQPPQHMPSGTLDEPMDTSSEDEGGDDGEQFDTAGFDPLNDENAFYRAVLHMESEGQFGGTDESRAEIMQTYGIRDRSHWHTVKESCYSVLAQQYGGNEVSQREMNWRQGEMQKHMMGQVQNAAASG